VSRHLIIFTRYPEPHRTKTRMIPRLGPEGAAQLQGDMTDHALAWARELAGQASVSVQVRFEGGNEARMRSRFGDSFPYLRQGPGDLGDRMLRAIAEAFAAGADRVIVVGTDCPDITSGLAEEAFERLATADLVLGPATDGGYYLIGLRRPIPALFAGIAWGQETVLRETRNRAEQLGLATSLLTALSDVDRPEDLPVWQRAKGDSRSPSALPRISVIIPTLNEANHLDDTLSALQGTRNIETIVVDGGSCDGTDSLALDRGALLVRSAAGRACQMNAGALAATGEILLFLHADTRLPERFDEQVRELIARRAIVAGAFRLRIDGTRRAFRLIEWMVNIRSRWLQMPYGDQAIFLRSDTFHRLGGFPELPIMEDFEFIRRLRKHGKIAIASASATTSARRWEMLGPWRTTWINQRIILGYHLGISPDTLAKWYAGSRFLFRGMRPHPPRADGESD
jgi:uncharacterized protein